MSLRSAAALPSWAAHASLHAAVQPFAVKVVRGSNTLVTAGRAALPGKVPDTLVSASLSWPGSILRITDKADHAI